MFVSNVYLIVTTIMEGVVSYFPSPGVVQYVVSICIPSEQEFGGSVEIRRPNVDISNDMESKRPSVFIMPA